MDPRLHDDVYYLVSSHNVTHFYLFFPSTSTFFNPFNNKSRVSFYTTPLTGVAPSLLCDDILQKIGEEFKKIPNKPIDKIKHTHICRRCKQTQYSYSIDLSDGDGWEDSCGDCNMRDR